MHISNKLVLGTMYFGTKVPEKDCFAILDRYVELGGRYIDTANNYADWIHIPNTRLAASERVLGKWLMCNSGIQKHLTITTKLGQGIPYGFYGQPVETALVGIRDRLGIIPNFVLLHCDEEHSARVNLCSPKYDENYVNNFTEYWKDFTWHNVKFGISNIMYGVDTLSLNILKKAQYCCNPSHPIKFDNEFIKHYTPSLVKVFRKSYTVLEAYSPFGPDGILVKDDGVFKQTTLFECLSDVQKLESPCRLILSWFNQVVPFIHPVIGVSSVQHLEECMATTDILSNEQVALLRLPLYHNVFN